MAAQNNLPGSIRISGFDNGELTTQLSGGGDRVVNLSKPSIVRINASPGTVNFYERQGDDLIVHMKDGSTVRYQHFFTLDASGHHSEMYLDDAAGSHHVTFPASAEPGPAAAQSVAPTYTDSAPIAAAPSGESNSNALLWTGLGLLGVGGIALAAGGGGGGGGGGSNNGGSASVGSSGNKGANGTGSNASDPAPDPASTLTINTVAGDDVISAIETQNDQSVTGSTQAFNAGRTITLTLEGNSWTTTVGSNGNWSITLPTATLQQLAVGGHTLTVTFVDVNGKTITASHDFTVNLTVPAPTIDMPFGDGYLNLAEQGQDQVVHGKTGITGAGQSVVVGLNGQNYIGTVDDNGNWQVSLPSSVLKTVPDGTYPLTVVVVDSDGNLGQNSVNVTVDTVSPVLVIDPIGTNDVIYKFMLDTGQDQTVHGSTDAKEVGDKVTVTINGKTYNATVGADGHWQANIPAIDLVGHDGSNSATVVITDLAGNSTQTTKDFSLNLTSTIITLNAFAGDNVLDGSEMQLNQTLSGETQNAPANSTVSITFAGKTYSATIAGDGSWHLTLTPSDLALADGSYSITATIPGASANENFTVTTTAPSITIDTISTDDYVNSSEIKQPVTISGVTTLLGASVAVTLNGKTYAAVVDSSGKWTTQIPAADLAGLKDGPFDVQAQGTLGSQHVEAHHTLNVLTALPGLQLDSMFSEGYLNADEVSQGASLTGTATHLPVGATVVAYIGGVGPIYGTVDSVGHWHVDVLPGVLKPLHDGQVTVTVSAQDAYGNPASASGALNVLVDHLPVAVLHSPVFGDGILDLSEAQAGQVFTGNSGVTGAGQNVSIYIDGVPVKGQVDTNGNWSVYLPPSLLTALPDGGSAQNSIEVKLTDRAGNVSTSTEIGFVVQTHTMPAPVAMQAMSVSSLQVNEADSQQHSTGTSDGTTSQTASVTDSPAIASTQTTTDTTQQTTTDTTQQTTTDTGSAPAFTIGGLSIDLADGTSASGSSVHGGAGNDTIHLSTLGFVQIDGGAGTDTLVLEGVNMNLDLTTAGSKVQHVEIVDLGLTGSNSVTLNLNEALTITDKPEDDLLVKGVKGDQVNLVHGNGDVWEISGTREVNGVNYDVYHNSSDLSNNGLGDVLVQQGLHVNLV